MVPEEDVEGRPRKAAKAEGVSDVASAGGGRPVILAKSVRSQRKRAKMPRMEPMVLRRLANCSATETIATEAVSVLFPNQGSRAHQRNSNALPYRCFPASERIPQTPRQDFR